MAVLLVPTASVGAAEHTIRLHPVQGGPIAYAYENRRSLAGGETTDLE